MAEMEASYIFKLKSLHSRPQMYTYNVGLVRLCEHCLSQKCVVTYLAVEQWTEVYICSQI